jgi:hypothetical protein
MANMGVNTVGELYNFSFKDNYVNVDKTGAPHKTAHPDNTVLFSGFARYVDNGPTFVGDTIPTSNNTLRMIGATTTLSVSDSQQVQPMKELGSSRFIMTTTNAPVTLSASSLLINGPNFLKALYTSAASIFPTEFASAFGDTSGTTLAGSTVIGDPSDDGWANLDHPIFQIPFGIGIASRNVGGDDILAVYAECCLVQNWTYTIAAGQTSVFTNASIIADRIVPIKFGNLPNNAKTAIQITLDKLTRSNNGNPKVLR